MMRPTAVLAWGMGDCWSSLRHVAIPREEIFRRYAVSEASQC